MFGEKDDTPVTTELTQIHDMETYEPVEPKTMTYEDRKKALASLLFITEKRNGDIKARKVASDGSRQRSYDGYIKSDGSSLSVVTDRIFMTGVVDVKEDSEVAILDIANAFLRAENDERILMILRCKLAEIVVKIDPSLYRNCLMFSPKGVIMLYVWLSKVLYGMLRAAALLFYKRLRSNLGNMSFGVNPYNPCVANTIVNGKQMTICWHADGLNVSHVEKLVVAVLAINLKTIYGPKTTISRAKVHDHLGIEIKCGTDQETMLVSMIKYLQKIIEDFPETLRGTKESTVRDNLFESREEENIKLLPEEQASQFHQTVAQLLFLCMRDRPDVQTLVSFLTTRVKQPNKDEWGKRGHVLMYLKGTLYMKRYMSADSLCIIKWWVDALYGVHWDGNGAHCCYL